jgi:hypothetical protein
MENRGMPGAVGSSSSRPEEQVCKKVKVVYARGRKPAQDEGGNNQMPIGGGVEKAKAAKCSEAVVRRGKAKKYFGGCCSEGQGNKVFRRWCSKGEGI